MPIVYKKGSVVKALADGQIDAMAHGCNCSGGFGSGVAAAVAKKWPHVKEAYKKHHKDGKCNLGDIHGIGVKGGIVLNCFTQEKYGRKKNFIYLDYDALEKTMQQIHRIVLAYEKKIGIPKIGAGLAGGDWDKIEAIINGIFKKKDIYVYVLDQKDQGGQNGK